MEKQLIAAILAVCIHCSSSATEQTKTGEPDYLVYPYCFRFTWLGPKYNSDSIVGNATCSTLLEDAKDIPCKRPLIATNNSNIPDTVWLWEHYKKSKPNEIACRLTRGDVCVKYSYTYNGAVQNITYMCTKVNIDGEGPVTSSCYTQSENGREVEVCVCESTTGTIPCNKALETAHYNVLTTIFNIILTFSCYWLLNFRAVS